MPKSTDHTQTLRDVRALLTILEALGRALHVIARRPIDESAGIAITAIADLSAYGITRSTELIDSILALLDAPGPAPPKAKP